MSGNRLQLVRSQLEESAQVKKAIAERLSGEILRTADKLLAVLRAGNKLLFCGNGGSAADAQHLAAELVSRLRMERAAIPALALTTDTSVITAQSNDYSFESVFARQIEALGRPGDALIAISTSGRSANVLAALRTARERGLLTVGLTGKDGGQMPELCDVCLIVPSQDTQRIQEGHITIGHVLCDLIERGLFA